MIEDILQFTNDFIKANAASSQENLQSILKFSNISYLELDDFFTTINEKACINLHFHPDRLSKDGLVIESLLKSGVYKNQYQTNTSSGSLSAIMGGDRDNWENELFGNIFRNKDIDTRPKYGALNLTLTADGASPRFGSCYFVTRPEVKNRSTFTYGDSHLLPKLRGTINNFHQLLLGLFEDVFVRNFALGRHYESVTDFFFSVTKNLETNVAKPSISHNLDFYIEAQIHGTISLTDDISDVVVDYSYKGTSYETYFEAIASRHHINLQWNTGVQLLEDNFPNNFRGNEIPAFVKHIADNGKVNAYILGKSIADKNGPNKYSDVELFQLYKYVWHCLVKFGKPMVTGM